MSAAATITIGGSEAASAIGLRREHGCYVSRIELWSYKTGLLEREPAGEAAQWGNLLEEVVREQAAEREGVRIEWVDGWAPLHDDYDFMHGHPDGMVSPLHEGPVALYEGKTCSPFVKGWEDNGVPAAYIAQAMHYMVLTGFERCLFACLVGGQRLETRWIEKDERFTELMLEAEAEFVDLCWKETPPAPDGSAATDEMLKRLYASSVEGGVVNLTPDDMAVVKELRALKEAAKETERQIKEREQVLKLRLGENELGVFDGSRAVSWKHITAQVKATEAHERSYRRFTT